jgi:hypothetical protein
MRRVLFVAVLASIAFGVQAVPQGARPLTPSPSNAAPQRKIPCETPANASMCYWTRGRLQVTEGAGAWRMWKVGTKRIVDVYNGPSKFPPRTQEEVQDPEFPSNLEKAYRTEVPRLERLHRATPEPVYADFEICPLEPEKPGASQAVCIESAKNMFFDESKHLYH